MTYQEALKKANAFISNELALARSTLDDPSTLNIFIGGQWDNYTYFE